MAESPGFCQMTDVLTYHNDNARTGQTLHEEVLSEENVNTNHFGKLRILPTDDRVDAQPLYAAGVRLPGQGMRNVLFVATEHDSVYAFDADSSQIFWRVSLLGAQEVPSVWTDHHSCTQVMPYLGVTATPVIDRKLGPNGTLFVVAMSKAQNGSTFFQRLHALDLATGLDQVPVAKVTAVFPGTGAHSQGGYVIFDPAQYKERPGLLLLNGIVYTAWSSHCDIAPYTGWIIGYDERTLAQTDVFNITPNGSDGSIWMSGGGLATDSDNNIYFLAANGTLDTSLNSQGFPSQGNYGNAFVKLSTAGNSLSVADYFATFESPTQNSRDLDLGSGGALVLPDLIDTQGTVHHLAVGAGKDQNIYLVDRSNMGKFNPANDNAIYQKVSGSLSGNVYSTPAFFNDTLYFGPVGGPLKAYPLQNARLAGVASHTSQIFRYPGATSSVSANGTNNGIVWATESNLGFPAVLHAYSATNLGSELYNSALVPLRDDFGQGNKFITATIASARVYVGTPNGVAVFGLLDQTTLTPVQVWRDNHFGNPSNVGGGADGATPAGDNVANLIKYALGLDPFQPATAAQLPIGTLEPIGENTYPVLTVERTATAPDVLYQVEVSSDLNTWRSGPPFTITVVDADTQLIVRSATPVNATPQFMRLSVARIPGQ
jgi:hypothetical protein